MILMLISVQPNPKAKDGDMITEIITKVIEDIWDKYDVNGNNYLDRDEIIRFISATMNDLEAEHGMQPTKPTEEELDVVIAEFDKDGNGTISRGEMASFVKRTAGL